MFHLRPGQPRQLSFLFATPSALHYSSSPHPQQKRHMTHPATLKIACLHGYCQNAQLFRLKTGGLRKSLERTFAAIREDSSSSAPSCQIPMAELHYLNAPFVLEERSDAQPVKLGQRLSESNRFNACFRPAPIDLPPQSACDRAKRSWWITENDGKTCIGWTECLQYLRDVFREKKYDGILGFSQGAIVASLICALRSDKSSSSPEFSSLRFAIMVSGYPARATTLQHCYDVPIAVPSMHVWGAEDNMIPGYASRLLLEKFEEQDRSCIVHPKGHLVPSDANSRKTISQFVLRFSEQLSESYEDRLRAAL